jgi:hypothetical protein
LKTVPMTTRLRVRQSFDAKLVTSRRCETFASGELLMLVNESESSPHSTFVRVNGLRPTRGVEFRYVVDSDELKAKTEITLPGR